MPTSGALKPRPVARAESAPAKVRSATEVPESVAITLIAAALAAFGVVMVYSSTSIGSELRHGDPTLFLRKQVLWVALASIVFALARTTSLDWLRARAPVILAIALALLVLVLVPGIGAKVGGSRRWIRLGGANGQPSELAKLALIVFASAWAAGKGDRLRSFKEGFLPPFAVVCATAGLIAIEPDMGTATFCAVVSLGVLVVGGMRILHLALVAAPGALGVFAIAVTKLGYIAARVNAFMDPDADARGVSYQIHQAVIALGSGGPFGLGLGASRQKRLFLPDAHTDFIFALIGEELGFVGCAILLSVYVAVLVLAARAVARAKDEFRLLLGTGLALALGLQAALNVAVATASVPPKGIALPFVSFGGSSLLFCAAAAGLLAKIAAEPRRGGSDGEAV